MKNFVPDPAWPAVKRCVIWDCIEARRELQALSAQVQISGKLAAHGMENAWILNLGCFFHFLPGRLMNVLDKGQLNEKRH